MNTCSIMIVRFMLLILVIKSFLLINEKNSIWFLGIHIILYIIQGLSLIFKLLFKNLSLGP